MPVRKLSSNRAAIGNEDLSARSPDRNHSPCVMIKKLEIQIYLIDLLKDTNLAEEYIRCVAEMIRELHRLTSGNTRLPKFLMGHRYSQEFPVSITLTVGYEARGGNDADGGQPEILK